MRKLPTTVVLGGWFGFLVISALIEAASILSIANPGFSAGPWLTQEAAGHAKLVAGDGEVGLIMAALTSLVSLMTAGYLALALVLAHRPSEAERRLSEGISFACFGVIAALALAAAIFGVTTFANMTSQVPLWIILALSCVSIVFDRLVEVPEEDPREEEDFRAALSLIATSMARDPHRNPPKPDLTERRRP